jgi:hypothetical protein
MYTYIYILYLLVKMLPWFLVSMLKQSHSGSEGLCLVGDPNCLGPGSLGIEAWPVPGSDDLPHQPGECPHYIYI